MTANAEDKGGAAAAKALGPVRLPAGFDYVGVYLTRKCHLKCGYCITGHGDTGFRDRKQEMLRSGDWIRGLNRLVLPEDTPVTLQGGEPFLYPGIWELLDGLRQKADILTALPPKLDRGDFLRLKTLDWNKRAAPYPTIRVSYHHGQHDYRELVERISGLNDILSIGLFCLSHPAYSEEYGEIKEFGAKHGVEVRQKEFLGHWEGRLYGTYKYTGACSGKKRGVTVRCRNTVVPVGPDGDVYRCHSDLYFGRKDLRLGNILDGDLNVKEEHQDCDNYGTCSECDVKVKTNRYQQYGYTSVDIQFPGGEGDGQEV